MLQSESVGINIVIGAFSLDALITYEQTERLERDDALLTTLLATVVKRPSTKSASSGPDTRPTAVTPNWRMPSNSEAATAIPMLANPMILATMRVTRTSNGEDITLLLFDGVRSYFETA